MGVGVGWVNRIIIRRDELTYLKSLLDHIHPANIRPSNGGYLRAGVGAGRGREG